MLSATEQRPRVFEARSLATDLTFPIALPTTLHWLEAGSQKRIEARENIRRWLNIVVAAVCLVLGMPLMLLIALLVKLSSRGPVIYRQIRVGIDRRTPGSGGNWRRTVDYGGRLFTIYKFRTMRCEPAGARQVWATEDDPRTTRVGRLLRKYRLDELPQLWNVLRGDMNIVGPRPEQPDIFMDLRTQLTDYSRRQRVLPGITGWAQINQHYDTCIEDVRSKLRLDLQYIQDASASRDLMILARTLPVVVLQKGAW